MEFSYDSAMARVSGELETLTEELWHYVIDGNKWLKNHEETVIDKTFEIYAHRYRIKDGFKQKKFDMFYNLKDRCYWHATDNWGEVRKTLTGDEEAIYAALMLEQAENDTRRGTVGPVWIVQSYDNGNLKEFISDDLLKESVNKGFWKLANEYFTAEHSALPHEAYDMLMKYSGHLDLRNVSEFMDKPLISRQYGSGWVDERYIKAFERARGDLDSESGAWLARPIIEKAIVSALSPREENKNREKKLKKQLENYAEYLDTALIQKLIKAEIEQGIRNIDSGNAFWLIRDTEILAKYIILPEAALQEVISSKLDTGAEKLHAIVREGFPLKWLASWKLSEIKEKIIAYVDSPSKGERKKEIIPHLDFLNMALMNGYMDEEAGKEKIEARLQEYLAKSRIRSGAVESLLISLKPEYVSGELYRKAVNRGIGQMLNSARTIKSAHGWYQKAKDENWLDESQISGPKLQMLMEYGERLEKARKEEAEKLRQKDSNKGGIYRPRRKHGLARFRKKAVKRPTSARSADFIQTALDGFFGSGPEQSE